MSGRSDARSGFGATADETTEDVGSTARGRRRERERGAALVEMAIVLPLLLMIVFGIVEFGTTYSNYIGLRDGVRQAARSGAVGNMGTTTSCSLTGASEASTNVKQLMCLTKDQTGLAADEVRVKVLSATPDFDGAGTFAKNDALIVCAQVPTSAVTGFLGSALAGKTLRTKVAMRIEQSDLVATAGDEDPPSGEDWSWCTYEALSV